MQGGTFTFLAPTFAILSLPHNRCPSPFFSNSTIKLYNDTDGSIVDGSELWMRRMREVFDYMRWPHSLQLHREKFPLAATTLHKFIGTLCIISDDLHTLLSH